ncbi:MAG: hypothetical protein HN509_07045 [Halobacteriovoraceae bacterium]|jgi:hypothetical protein|nr:hypothetical protein [Halobacteriovoraceae bacterium]
MDTTQKLNILAKTIPQLYESTGGEEQIDFELGESTITRYSFRGLTPALKLYRKGCINLIRSSEKANYNFLSIKSDENRLRELFAMEWLSIKTGLDRINVMEIVDYFYKLASRTNENSFICKNVILDLEHSAGDQGSDLNLKNSNIDKALDLIASGPFTYLLISSDMEIIDYCSATLTDSSDSTSYKFYPEFLHVLSSRTTEKKILFTLTSRGDFIICQNKEMIASKRRGEWTVCESSGEVEQPSLFTS